MRALSLACLCQLFCQSSKFCLLLTLIAFSCNNFYFDLPHGSACKTVRRFLCKIRHIGRSMPFTQKPKCLCFFLHIDNFRYSAAYDCGFIFGCKGIRHTARITDTGKTNLRICPQTDKLLALCGTVEIDYIPCTYNRNRYTIRIMLHICHGQHRVFASVRHRKCKCAYIRRLSTYTAG